MRCSAARSVRGGTSHGGHRGAEALGGALEALGGALEALGGALEALGGALGGALEALKTTPRERGPAEP